MGDVKAGIRLDTRGAGGYVQGDSKDVIRNGVIGLGVLIVGYGGYKAINYAYEKACKIAGLNTKDNPHNNELGPRFTKKSNAVSTPQAAIESGDKAEDEKEMLPEWKLLLREGQEEDDEAVSMEDVENSTDPEVLQEIIYQGINLIAANEKVGKTIFCMHLATALAKGERTEILPQQGIAVRQHVCYYDFENGKSVIHKNFSKRIDEAVNKGDLELFTKAFDAGEMLEEIAKKVAKYHYKYKHLTFVVDCIYDMEVDETDELQQGLKRIGSNAMDDYGCQVTILLVQHLNDNDKVKGSKNLKRAASTIITLVPDPSDDNLVQISWKGRCVTKGSTMCIRKGPLEGYYNDLHYEPYEMTPDSTSQLDSASLGNEEENNTKTSYSREKIELTEEQLCSCRDVYDKAISSGKGKKAALEEAAEVVLQGKISYKTLERRLEL